MCYSDIEFVSYFVLLFSGLSGLGEFMQDQICQFLSKLPLFSDLPENELSQMAGEISVEIFPKNTVLSVQGRTKLESVYIIKEGLLELFYETNGERELSGSLKPGESFGGVSILMNAGISVRTVKIVDDATLYM
jgi:CBS domain-containing protein